MNRLLLTLTTILLIFCFGYNLTGTVLFSDRGLKCYNGVNLINETDYEVNLYFKNDDIQINNKVLFFGNIEKSSGYTLSSGSSFNTFVPTNLSSTLYLGMGGTGNISLLSDFGTETEPVLIDLIVKLKGTSDKKENKVQISFFATEKNSVTNVCAVMKAGKNSVNIFDDSIQVEIEPAGFAGTISATDMTLDCNYLFTIKLSQLKTSPPKNEMPNNNKQ